METFYALIRENYKKFGPYRVEIFPSYHTKEEVRKSCSESNYAIWNDCVYTKDEWNDE